MGGGISQLAVRLAELAEAESRVFKEHLERFIQRVLLLLGAAIVGLGGLVLLVLGVYLLLAEHMSPGLATVLIALAVILLAGVLFAMSTVFAGDLPGAKRPPQKK